MKIETISICETVGRDEFVKLHLNLMGFQLFKELTLGTFLSVVFRVNLFKSVSLIWCHTTFSLGIFAKP